MNKTGIIDFHTHAFPDSVAARAMSALQADAEEVVAHLDGTVGDLLRSMDQAGIEKSVICTIATRPGQFDGILRWCDAVRSDRIVPFPSIHPADEDRAGKIEQIKRQGYKGIKLHPFYQDFYLADNSMLEVFDAISDSKLILLLHCGYDIAFPRERRADPAGILNLVQNWPDLKVVSAHMGGWDAWDEVERYLIGKDIYMDMSFTLRSLGSEKTAQLIKNHGHERVLFGTDSPWNDQPQEVLAVKNMKLSTDALEAIFYRNATRLLSS